MASREAGYASSAGRRSALVGLHCSSSDEQKFLKIQKTKENSDKMKDKSSTPPTVLTQGPL